MNLSGLIAGLALDVVLLLVRFTKTGTITAENCSQAFSLYSAVFFNPRASELKAASHVSEVFA